MRIKRKGLYTDNGDGTASIPLTQGKHSLVDVSDLHIVLNYTWCYDNGYARTTIMLDGKQTNIRMHRLIIGKYKNKDIDHINGDRSDNRRINLRVCSHAENIRNSGKRINNKSGYKGVSWVNKRRKWRSTIFVKGKQLHLGDFDCPIEAHESYKKASIKYHGDFSNDGS